MDQSIYIEQLLSNGIPDTKNIPTKIQVKNSNDNKSNQNISDQKDDKPNIVENAIGDKVDVGNTSNPGKKAIEEKDDINIDFLIQEWPTILENINRIRPTVGAIIEDFIPDALENDVVFLKSTASQGYNEKMMERGTPIIEKQISEKTGKNIKVRFVNNIQEQTEESNQHDKDQEKTDPNDEKVYNRIVELFDGEPIK